ncbi:MAG TPA: YkvA family protein [Bacillota bacterium]|nr:YkvA family protein [Bacillota bacterium]
MNAVTTLKQKLVQLKNEIRVLYLAYKDPRVPWYARLFTAFVVGYAFSPIDLIPDFIPILGYLDDLLLIPLGVYLALKLIPTEVLEEYRTKIRECPEGSKPVNRLAAAVIILIWLFATVLLVMGFYRHIK